MTQILDCTLRDGGYYTNWDFNSNLVESYIDAFNQLPVEYLEIGYRSKPLKGYLGEYFYCPVYVIQNLKSLTNKNLVIILNEKDVRAIDVSILLAPCIGLIDMVRIAIDPKNFLRAIDLAKAVKLLGFKVGFNVMYMSSWKSQKDFLKLLPEVNGIADYFYMVDSYGGAYPEDIRETYNLIKSKLEVKVGFHGHNNLELALINTLTAIECGVDIVDATVTGMGRGAGNLKTELLLTALNAQGKIDFDFNPLSKVVDAFSKLQNEYKWGTNLPYMVSGANSLPQNEVMNWVGKRYYSFNSIIRALDNQSKGVQDNQRLPEFKLNDKDIYSKALIVGGGPSAVEHATAIKKYLEANPGMLVIHASSKNAMAYKTVSNKQIFCLVGNEGYRMEDVFLGDIPNNAICVLPPYPRKMGTYIPKVLKNKAFELGENSFTDKYVDSHTSIALQASLILGIKEIEIVGYDGYASGAGTKERELFIENEYLFSAFKNAVEYELTSLTPTSYNNLLTASIYTCLHEL